jgi:HlyD family secretion protein
MRPAQLTRRIALPLLLVGGLLALALWPSTVAVDLGAVRRGPLVVTIDGEGQTRVRERYLLSAPVAGRVMRIDLEPGDEVTRGQVVARVRPEPPALLDARTRAEAQAGVESARAQLGRARAEAQRTRALLAQIEREVTRLRQLAGSRVVAPQELEVKEAECRAAEDAARAAEFAAAAAQSEVQRAEVRVTPAPADRGGLVVVRAPTAGRVLKRLRESESVVPAGEPLLEIGDPARLEVVSDLLSTDAVRIRPGARATIEQWGGRQPLEGRVRRIEPAGFTKISALGVEEQRVNVVIDVVDPAAAWAALGDAYRVEVRVVIWEAASVLKVPTGALFRDGEKWAVYVVDNDRARRAIVEIGHQTGQEAEVTSGLAEGSRVIMHPGDTLAAGARVIERSRN